MKNIKITFVSNITANNVFTFEEKIDGRKINCNFLPYGQIYKNLLSKINTDFLIIHLTAEFFYEFANNAKIISNLNFFCDLINRLKNNNYNIILNTIPSYEFGSVGSDNLDKIILNQKINSSLIKLSKKSSNIYIVDLNFLLSKYGYNNTISTHNYHIFKLPYKSNIISKINSLYTQIISGRYISRKKVLAIDADNTLWHGILGDDGIDGIQIDDDYPGIIYKKFQRKLLELNRSGILLILVTKNDINNIKDVFKTKKMPLKLNNFVEIYANWEPKSTNIKKSSQNLNLLLDSYVFIDDNLFELEEVKNSLPVVETFQFDYQNISKSIDLLDSIDSLKTWETTKEDGKKTNLYKQENKRKLLKDSGIDYNKYLQSLNISINIYRNSIKDADRVSQLINKTNQFNLTNKKYSEAEIKRLMKDENVFNFKLIDKFGDMGIIGSMIIIKNEIDTFVISCRAFGRTIEKTIVLNILNKYFINKKILSKFIPSNKNNLVKNFYEDCDFSLIKKNNKGKKIYSLSKIIKYKNKYIKIRFYG